MFNRLKSAGSEFAFQMAIEFERPKIIKGLSDWLSGYKIEEFQRMIASGEMPKVDPHLFVSAQPYAKFLHQFSVLDLFEVIGEASPAVFQLIQDNGERGAAYLVNLRKYLIDSCSKPPSAVPVMVSVTCDSCGKKWPVTKEDAAKLTECPFCHTKAN